ncbi:MAG: arsenate reductase ArsC [Xanthomonadaceae bacterium]|nr:arsenate reductase ArsC [Xanthomonadaceae bacterium]
MKRVLFVCIENSNRSQMAEAFLRLHAPSDVEAVSSGSRPSGQVNPRAIQFMAERGYDLNTHHSKGLDDIPQGRYDYAITMGCGDECPLVDAAHRADWQLEDPKHLDDDGFRAVRDEIEQRVLTLLEAL